MLKAEQEEEALKMVDKFTAKGEIPKRRLKARISLPSCTSESVNYVLECFTCRKGGERRTYYGETSCSPYQRGTEHLREIEEGVLSHPLVLHFWEEHLGKRQPVMMRVTLAHLKPLNREVTESANILASNKVLRESQRDR